MDSLAKELDAAITTLQSNILATPPNLPKDADLTSLSHRLFSSNIGSIALRNLLTRLIAVIKMPQFPNYGRISFIPELLSQMETQATNTEEQAIDLRLCVADAYELAEDFEEVAKTLSRIPLGSSQRKMETEEKGKILIRIVRCYLEVDDPTGAETYLNRFKQIMHEVQDSESIIHYQLSQARIYDSRRDFLNASKGYHELTRLPELVSEEEQLHTLTEAVKCAVLAPAGPARSRALKRLYDDERTHRLDVFKILQNMHLQRLISPADYAAFSASLAEHQLAKMSDGLTVLQKAMFEHNLLAVSKVYANISVSRLGELLGMDEERAEQMTASMVQQGRLLGRIDGVERWIYFGTGEATGESSRVTGSDEGKMVAWDRNVEGLTKAVEEVFGMMSDKKPEWVEANLVIGQ